MPAVSCCAEGELVVMLKCYQCAETDKTEEAVAVCIVCGMALCADHANRVDLPIWEGGYPAPTPTKIKEKGLPRFMCSYCRDVILSGACE